jgi:hypothetical protein
MSDKDLAEFLADLERLRAEHTSTPEKARAFLVKEGVVDTHGELTEAYR